MFYMVHTYAFWVMVFCNQMDTSVSGEVCFLYNYTVFIATFILPFLNTYLFERYNEEREKDWQKEKHL